MSPRSDDEQDATVRITITIDVPATTISREVAVTDLGRVW
jgi:hypothetical protein